MWLCQDAFGNDFTVMEGLGGKPHLSQAAGVDESEHLKHTSKAVPPCGLRHPAAALPNGSSGLCVFHLCPLHPPSMVLAPFPEIVKIKVNS